MPHSTDCTPSTSVSDPVGRPARTIQTRSCPASKQIDMPSSDVAYDFFAATGITGILCIRKPGSSLCDCIYLSVTTLSTLPSVCTVSFLQLRVWLANDQQIGSWVRSSCQLKRLSSRMCLIRARLGTFLDTVQMITPIFSANTEAPYGYKPSTRIWLGL